MAFSMNLLDHQSAAEKAVTAIGSGYDLTADIRLSAIKPGPTGLGLIELDRTLTRDLELPCGTLVRNVSQSIKCGKGERTRFHSDVLTFVQVNFRFFFIWKFIFL